MGNLCSSGTDQSDKREENRVPDKPRDGEDEALLPKVGAALEVGPQGVQVSAEGDGGGGGGFLSGAVKSAEFGVAEVGKTAQDEGRRAAESVVQAGKEGAAKQVEEFQTSATSALSEAAVGVKTAAEGVVTQGVESAERGVSDAAASVKTAAEGAVTQGVESAKRGLSDAAAGVKTSAEGVVTQGVESAERAISGAAVGVKTAAEGAVTRGIESVERNVSELSQSAIGGFESVSQQGRERVFAAVGSLEPGVKGIEGATSHASDSSATGSILESGGLPSSSGATTSTAKGVFGNIEQQVVTKVDELKLAAASEADAIRQTAENAANEAVESARLSASETVSSWAESATQKVGNLTAGVIGKGQSAAESANVADKSLPEAKQGGGLRGQVSAFEQASEDLLTATKTGVQQSAPQLPESGQGLQQSAHEKLDFLQNFADNTTQSVASSAQTVRGSVEERVKSESVQFQESAISAGQGFVQQRAVEAENMFDDILASGAQSVSAEGLGRFESQDDKDNRRFDPFGDIQSVDTETVRSVVTEAVRSGVERAKEEGRGKVLSFFEGDRVSSDARGQADEEGEQFAADIVPQTEENFLDKANSLLEAHRGSVDESKVTFADVSVAEQDSSDESKQMDITEQQEATARDFVESIIEKATSLVAESLEEEQHQPASEGSSPSDASVERGEETLAPKKRGVMFASPNISDRSSSSLSSPQELSPPPPPESDLSPPGESTNSSVSQENEERLPLSSSADFLVNENNNNNNIINNNVEDDDESIQRIAMEVTAKAVQDAIKIVTENGSGTALNATNIVINNIAVSSPSSPDNDDEDMTTTDSSQVERGSPVSDLTDTSAHGSVSESLSSYDPGAVYRQDVANLADLSLSQADVGSAVDPAGPPRGQDTSKSVDLINFQESSATHVETPTPTNATTFDSYSHGDQQKSVVAPSQPFSSEVPFSLPSTDESPSSKPSIVINSPDSAHHTNSSNEDISSSQTEALI